MRLPHVRSGWLLVLAACLVFLVSVGSVGAFVYVQRGAIIAQLKKQIASLITENKALQSDVEVLGSSVDRPIITSPKSKEAVHPSLAVRGVIPPSEQGHIWLAVRQPGGHLFWPKKDLSGYKAGRWEVSLSQSDGPFDLVLIRLDDSANARVLQWMRERTVKGYFPGLNSKSLGNSAVVAEVSGLTIVKESE